MSGATKRNPVSAVLPGESDATVRKVRALIRKERESALSPASIAAFKRMCPNLGEGEIKRLVARAYPV